MGSRLRRQLDLPEAPPRDTAPCTICHREPRLAGQAFCGLCRVALMAPDRNLHRLYEPLYPIKAVKMTHALCEKCWRADNPNRDPYRMLVPYQEVCCSCGQWTTDGIYQRSEKPYRFCAHEAGRPLETT